MTVVLIATHRPLVMKGLAAAIGEPHPTWLLAFGYTPQATTHELAVRRVDLAIVDIAMDGLRGSHGLRRFASDYPGVAFIVLSPDSRIDTHRQELQGVAADCIADTDPTDRWLAAVHRVFASVSPPPPSPRPAPLPSPAPTARVALTGRQAEVIHLLAEGNSIKQIARCLGISPGTVKTHLSLAYTTLGVHNRVEAVLRAGAFGPLPLALFRREPGNGDSADAHELPRLPLPTSSE